MKYYAIVGNYINEIIGATSGRDGLLDVAEEENCPDVIEISAKEYDKFIKNDGSLNIKKLKGQRYKTQIIKKIKLIKNE